ncbi:MAG TPA: SGNH/GDSL hydrolase family protein [Polyangiaceae bacterium]|nr:SGNH/GDSL hydrolase family protein [Polyangiaceae bacterium]
MAFRCSSTVFMAGPARYPVSSSRVKPVEASIRRALGFAAVTAALSCAPRTNGSPQVGAAEEVGTDEGPALVRVVGRTEGPATARRFSWSGVSLQARFFGTEVSVDLGGGDDDSFEVIVDGSRLPRLATTSGRKRYSIASGLANGAHELVLWRRTEANDGSPSTFYGLDVGGGRLLPFAPKRHRIEVVGDSITCGYGNEGRNPCPFTYDTENDYAAYGSVAARALDADLHTECWSGKGVSRNIDGTTSELMPELFTRVIATDPASRWDFSWIPEAVVVNLGTNDFARGDPGRPYVTAYAAFVESLRERYPDAFVFLVIGPMLSGEKLAAARGYLDEIVAARKAAGDARIVHVLVETQSEANGIGCDYHPSEKTHALMGEVVASAIAKRLGW